mmetsp:Transcript_51616/g.148885  ORF Transcript_51616/g.148885 Transcript_51616/m.148885 type:complete len:136 (-) Transcript_51616:504-911(-)
MQNAVSAVETLIVETEEVVRMATKVGVLNEEIKNHLIGGTTRMELDKKSNLLTRRSCKDFERGAIKKTCCCTFPLLSSEDRGTGFRFSLSYMGAYKTFSTVIRYQGKTGGEHQDQDFSKQRQSLFLPIHTWVASK